eukprot:TRINITY_DN1899_c0_g1_i1.p1 TRINITY_DN1899_c0_g1~~TRINITY_DN1899_c0_g1_i1.p1  ORF type:complete len:1091 (-),score=334.39 TRINITY_DN1899_c0_g1_i1:7-3279(-)
MKRTRSKTSSNTNLDEKSVKVTIVKHQNRELYCKKRQLLEEKESINQALQTLSSFQSNFEKQVSLLCESIKSLNSEIAVLMPASLTTSGTTSLDNFISKYEINSPVPILSSLAQQEKYIVKSGINSFLNAQFERQLQELKSTIFLLFEFLETEKLRRAKLREKMKSFNVDNNEITNLKNENNKLQSEMEKELRDILLPATTQLRQTLINLESKHFMLYKTNQKVLDPTNFEKSKNTTHINVPHLSTILEIQDLNNKLDKVKGHNALILKQFDDINTEQNAMSAALGLAPVNEDQSDRKKTDDSGKEISEDDRRKIVDFQLQSKLLTALANHRQSLISQLESDISKTKDDIDKVKVITPSTCYKSDSELVQDTTTTKPAVESMTDIKPDPHAIKPDPYAIKPDPHHDHHDDGPRIENSTSTTVIIDEKVKSSLAFKSAEKKIEVLEQESIALFNYNQEVIANLNEYDSQVKFDKDQHFRLAQSQFKTRADKIPYLTDRISKLESECETLSQKLNSLRGDDSNDNNDPQHMMVVDDGNLRNNNNNNNNNNVKNVYHTTIQKLCDIQSSIKSIITPDNNNNQQQDVDKEDKRAFKSSISMRKKIADLKQKQFQLVDENDFDNEKRKKRRRLDEPNQQQQRKKQQQSHHDDNDDDEHDDSLIFENFVLEHLINVCNAQISDYKAKQKKRKTSQNQIDLIMKLNSKNENSTNSIQQQICDAVAYQKSLNQYISTLQQCIENLKQQPQTYQQQQQNIIYTNYLQKFNSELKEKFKKSNVNNNNNVNTNQSEDDVNNQKSSSSNNSSSNSSSSSDNTDEDLKKEIKSLKENIDSKEGDIEGLCAEIEALQSEFFVVQDDYIKVLKQFIESEETVCDLELQLLPLVHVKELLVKKNEIYNEKLSKLDTKVKLQEEYIKQLDKKHKALQEQQASTSQQLMSVQKIHETFDNINVDLGIINDELQTKLSSAKDDLYSTSSSSIKTSSVELINKIEEERKSTSDTMEQVITLNHKIVGLQLASQTSTDSRSSFLEEQLEHYKSKLKCSECRQNTKNCVISRCHHVFCRSCLEGLLENGDGRSVCPRCNSGYNANDLHNIYI